MKRYIRLKNGKIFVLTECCKESENTIIDKHSNWLNEKDIVAESDTITDLIQFGDLVCGKFGYLYRDIHFVFAPLKDMSGSKYIDEIYTKQGNDYILVARKTENEWEII